MDIELILLIINFSMKMKRELNIGLLILQITGVFLQVLESIVFLVTWD